jgi:hypothetical protein
LLCLLPRRAFVETLSPLANAHDSQSRPFASHTLTSIHNSCLSQLQPVPSSCLRTFRRTRRKS